VADPQDLYRSKLKTAEEAAALIPNGALIAQGNAIGEPQAMLEAIAQRARGGGFSAGITMMALLPMAGSARTILAPEVRGIIKWQSLFASGADRGLLKSGEASFVPAFFHQIPRIYEEFVDIDVAIVVVSPVDKHGYMSQA
jgi:acyl-CoA hydrolase